MAKNKHRAELMLTYQEAMTLSIVVDGKPIPVRDCPAAAFQAMVALATETTRNPTLTKRDLASCNYAHKADRWYSLLFLLEAGAKLPLSELEKSKS